MVINPIVGVYIPIIRIPVKGGMTIPNIATFDHGTYIYMLYSANGSSVIKIGGLVFQEPGFLLAHLVFIFYKHPWIRCLSFLYPTRVATESIRLVVFGYLAKLGE